MSNTRTKKAPKSVGEKLAAAQRIQDTMTIYLPGPDKAEWKRLRDEHDRIKATSTQMLNPDPKLKGIAAQLATLEERMRDNAIDVTVQAIRRQRTPATPEDEPTWSELCDKHPPRKGKDGKPDPDDSPGVNMLTFPEALIRASIIDPVMTEAELNGLLYEAMTEHQFDQLFGICWRLNKSPVDIPFSFAASKTLTSAAASRRPNGSASRPAASTAGSQPK